MLVTYMRHPASMSNINATNLLGRGRMIRRGENEVCIITIVSSLMTKRDRNPLSSIKYKPI